MSNPYAPPPSGRRTSDRTGGSADPGPRAGGSGAGGSSTGAPGTDPAGDDPSVAGPSGAGTPGTGTSGAGTSGTGTSGTGSSSTGPSGAGAPADGASGTGPSRTGAPPARHRPAGRPPVAGGPHGQPGPTGWYGPGRPRPGRPDDTRGPAGPVRPHGLPGAGWSAQPSTEPPAPEVVARAGRLVRHFGVYLLAALAVSVLPLPWRLGTLAFLVGAVLTGFRAIGAVNQARLRGGLMPMLALGLLMSGVLGISTVGSVATWSLDQDRETCLAGALTTTAQAACEQEYQDGITRWTSDLLDGAGSAE